MTGSTSRIIAVCFAFAAFAVAILSGLAAEVPAAQILMRATLAMFVCYLVGWGVGAVCEYVVHAHVSAMQPAPASDQQGTSSASAPAATGDDKEVIVV